MQYDLVMDRDTTQTWSDYVRRLLDAHYPDWTNAQVGTAIGASEALVGNWKKAKGFEQPSVQLAVAFWRAFGRAIGTTLPEAMDAAGFAEIEEFDTVVRIEPDLSMISNDEWAEETRRRMGPDFSGQTIREGVTTKPVSLREARVARAKRTPPL